MSASFGACQSPNDFSAARHALVVVHPLIDLGISCAPDS